MLQYNKLPLYLAKFQEIANKNPEFVAQSCMLDCGHNLTIWFVGQESKYYCCIG